MLCAEIFTAKMVSMVSLSGCTTLILVLMVSNLLYGWCKASLLDHNDNHIRVMSLESNLYPESKLTLIVIVTTVLLSGQPIIVDNYGKDIKKFRV